AAIAPDRLKAALTLGQPRIDSVRPVPPPPKTMPPTSMPPRPGPKRLQISGRNLIGDRLPVVKLKGQPLSVTEADDDRLVVDIPEEAESGALELEMPDGSVMSYDLALDAADEWAPEVRS